MKYFITILMCLAIQASVQAADLRTAKGLSDACVSFTHVDIQVTTRQSRAFETLSPGQLIKSSYCSGYLWGVVETMSDQNRTCTYDISSLVKRDVVQRFHYFVGQNEALYNTVSAHQIASKFAFKLLACDD